MKFITLLITYLVLTFDGSMSWRTLDDDTSPQVAKKNDVWKWESFENHRDEEEDEDGDDGDNNSFPEKLTPLTNNNWLWQSSAQSLEEHNLPSASKFQHSHRKKKQFFEEGYDGITSDRKGFPRISTELYKAILGESKSFQEVVSSILNPVRILEEYYSVFANRNFQNKIRAGNLDEAKISIEEKLCELGLMKCTRNRYPPTENNNDVHKYTKPFVFVSTKTKRETKQYATRQSNSNTRIGVNNYGTYTNGDVANLGNLGNLGSLASLGNLPQTFAGLSQKNIAPTFGFSFGLPIPTNAYPFNVLGGGVPAVNPYFGALSPNGVKLGLINVNPLVSVQYTKDEYGDKIVKPLVHLHITPNEHILQRLSGFLKSKKQEALHNYHHHYHEHEYPYPPPPPPPVIHPHPIEYSGPIPPFSYPPAPQLQSHPIEFGYPPSSLYAPEQQLYKQKEHQHQHHHFYDDFNSKFIHSSDNTAIPNYQYGLLYPHTKVNAIVKPHISDLTTTNFANGAEEVSYETTGRPGYQHETESPFAYEDYYGITRKSQNSYLKGDSGKLIFPDAKSNVNSNTKQFFSRVRRKN